MAPRRPYMRPKELLELRRKAGLRLAVGDWVNLHEGDIAMDPVPGHGAIPPFRITSLTPDGGVATAVFECQKPGCHVEVEVFPGDLFHKRFCPECKRGSTRGRVNTQPAVSPGRRIAEDLKPASTSRADAAEVGRPQHPDWAGELVAYGVRCAFVHIAEHGVATEMEVVGFLGSPRAYRRFALEFDEHARKLPFKVRIETTPDGKRYVREGEK